MPSSRTCSIHPFLVIVVLLFSICAAPRAMAQDVSAASSAGDATGIDITAPVGAQSGPYSLGIGSSWPAYGVSGTDRVSEIITSDVILGMMGTVQSFAGRGWYRFKQDPTYDLYGFVTVGLFRYDYTTFVGFNPVSDTESVLGLGAGVGVELSFAKILDNPDFPPLYWNLDIGFVHADFDYYDWSGFAMGGGIHYRFGK